MTECSIGSDDTDGRGTIDEGTVSVEPETGGLRAIAGVLSSIFDEDSRHFFVQKSAKLKRFGYNATGSKYLDAVEWSMNNRMKNLPMFDYSTSSPYFQDYKDTI